MPADLRLDLVHTSPVVSTALRHALRSGPRPTRVTTAVHSWTDFQREWDFAGDIVVVDALLDDHVPLPLKVRALRRLGSQVIVLGPGRGAPFARRAGAEGACAWIEPTTGLDGTAQVVLEVALGAVPPDAALSPVGPPRAALTDRELQVLGLYVSARGHSPTYLGRVLALRTEPSAATSSGGVPGTAPSGSPPTTGLPCVMPSLPTAGHRTPRCGLTPGVPDPPFETLAAQAPQGAGARGTTQGPPPMTGRRALRGR